MVPLDEMIGKSLKELDFREKYHCQVLALKDREPKKMTYIPEPDMKIKTSHILIILGKDMDLANMHTS
jgi:trk/ktr system potassium uptake protein